MDLMSKVDIHRQVVKMLTRSATKRDLDLIYQALQDSEQKKIFKEYLQIDFIVRIALEKKNLEQTKSILLERIRKDKRKQFQRKRRKIMQVAASFFVLLATAYFLGGAYNESKGPEGVNHTLDPIVLYTGGETKVVDHESSLIITDEEGNTVIEKKEDTLVYKAFGIADHTINKLKVPYGKTMNLVLADGSKVFLNAGSTIEFPTNFIHASHREVFITGEAYFDIAKDKEQPFLVQTNQVEVQVVGTAFNVSNYPEDLDTKVALVEGVVDMIGPRTSKDIKQIIRLKPGQQGVFHKENNVLTAESVNVARYTAWLSGRVIFVNETFEQILVNLERKYNVILINNNEALAKERFNATIDINNESIEQVMDFFNKVYNIDYQIVQNKIIIK